MGHIHNQGGITLNLFRLQAIDFAAARTYVRDRSRAIWMEQELEDHAFRHIGCHVLEAGFRLAQGDLGSLMFGNLSA
jgi:hypothetical protein